VQAYTQKVGIGTNTPDSTLDVRGNFKFGGLNKFLSYDSASGKISWSNSYLYLPNNQQLIQHSASAGGLFYNNSALEYRNQFGDPVFSTNWNTGTGYFGGNVGIGTTSPGAKLHIQNGISGFIYNYSSLIVETNANNYISFFTPDNYQSAILFEKPAHLQSGGIYYNSPSAPDGFIFRANNAPRVYISNNGNTGIGKFPASEKLEVNGTVKADSFKFSNPRTYYYSMDATGFTIEEGNFEVRKLYTQGAYIVGSSNTLVAPLSLPHNAVLKSLTAYVYDISSTLNLSVIMARRDNSIFRLQIGGIASSGNSGLVSYSSNFPDNPTNIIDNLQYSYMLTVGVIGANSWPANGDLQIKRVVVAYTLPEVQ
jgi:hypothetical protein